TGGANIVFELTDKEPSGGARIVKKIIAENAGLKLKPEFKVVQQLAQVNEDEPDEDIDINAELADQEDDETDEEENVQSPLSPPEAPPLRGQESAAEKEWKWRFEAIQKD